MKKNTYEKEAWCSDLLTKAEHHNPLLVIHSFFDADDLQGHLQDLKNWRDCVIEDRYYTDRQGSPACLLFIHELNSRLIGAAWLLFEEAQNGSLRHLPLITDDSQLQLEKETWDTYPINLDQEQLRNPLLVISDFFFKDYTIKGYQQNLKLWLEFGLSIFGVTEEIEPYEIVKIYENLQKLQEAAFVIHRRITNLKHQNYHRKAADLSEEKKNSLPGISNVLPQPAKRSFNPNLTPAEKLGLDHLIREILVNHPAVRLIIHLGTYPIPFTYYLLILVDHENTISNETLSRQIENKYKSLVRLVVLIYQVNTWQEPEAANQGFYGYALENGTVVYRSPGFELPGLATLMRKLSPDQLQLSLQELKTPDLFLKQAMAFLSEEKYSIAGRLLHFSIEKFLSQWLGLMTCYRSSRTELSRLFDLTLMITDELKDVFEPESEEGQRLYRLLTDMFSETRASAKSTIDGNDIRHLIGWYERLRALAIIHLHDSLNIDQH